MINYFWIVSALEAYPSYGDHENVVFQIHWRYRAEDEAEHSSELYGFVSVNYEDEQEFVVFENLTPDLVEEWIESALGADRLAEMRAMLAAKIQEQVTPSRVTLDPPWAISPT
jgi:hypothetical protein